MSRPKLQAVVAMASNRVIGKEGKLPWKLSEDLKWFKKLTLGHPVVMGRKTMESLRGPLPDRRNIVISRSEEYPPRGFELVRSCEEAIDLLAEQEIISIIGGAQIYAEMLSQCDEVYLSFVEYPYDGDTTLHEFESDFELAEILYEDGDFELRRYVKS